jgi:protein-arginine deiminase
MSPEAKEIECYVPGSHAGPTNLQPVAGKLYVPRQFCPVDASGDIFERAIRAALGSGVEFVDCWDLYHACMGEVHCGSNVKRSPLGMNWWEDQP